MLQPVDLVAAWRDATYYDPELFRKAASRTTPQMLGVYGFMAAMATEDVDPILAMKPLRLDDINTRDQDPCAPMLFTRKA